MGREPPLEGRAPFGPPPLASTFPGAQIWLDLRAVTALSTLWCLTEYLPCDRLFSCRSSHCEPPGGREGLALILPALCPCLQVEGHAFEGVDRPVPRLCESNVARGSRVTRVKVERVPDGEEHFVRAAGFVISCGLKGCMLCKLFWTGLGNGRLHSVIKLSYYLCF